MRRIVRRMRVRPDAALHPRKTALGSAARGESERMTQIDQTEAAAVKSPAAQPGQPASRQVPVRPAKVGVMLLNLGTPDGTEFKPMWRYLREFLSDPRIVELNKLIWYPILYGIVLTVRPKKSGEN